MSEALTKTLPRKYKLVVLGDQSVGKTSIIKRFIDDKFEGDYSATIGIDFLCKSVYLEKKTVRLQMWDTAGQERFKSLIPSYIRDSNVCLIIYDITSLKSFNNCFDWLKEVRSVHNFQPGIGEQIICWIVGNKTDLSSERKVSFETLKQKATENECSYIETSAKAGTNIKKLFYDVARSLPDSESEAQKEESKNYFVIPLKKDEDDEVGPNRVGTLKGDAASGCTGYC